MRHYPKIIDAMIDVPIIGLVNGFNKLPYCFTLQSCYGHFVCNGQKDPHNLEPFPVTDAIREVEYRIAYIAVCLENSALGKRLFNALREITTIDPENVQFCCAEWFWKRQVNSYALQVEPGFYSFWNLFVQGKKLGPGNFAHRASASKSFISAFDTQCPFL